MADVILTSIINIVSALCSCTANNRCCYILDLQENKEALNNALTELKANRDRVKIKVDEAENNPDQKCTPDVDNWLQGVQTIDVKVVQVIQKVDQEIEGRCFGANCPINCWSAHKIGKLVIHELAIVKDHKIKGEFFVGNDVAVTYKLPPPLIQREPMDSIVGMESMFDKVWRLVVEDEVSRIIGLYGYGGVGKTTLLKQINNEFLKTTATSSSNSTHGFDVVILVVVSKVINIDAIQKEIGNRLGLSSPNRRSIFDALTNKNFVLLLDDIWERVDLQSIGIPPPLENKKSKVVFTTRSEIVCGHMDSNTKYRVECLPWENAWTLFQEKVGNETLNSLPKVPEFELLAQDVARECGGLPLALITIGRAMSSKKTVQEWKHAKTTLRNSASEFPGMSDEVLPLLKLSYDSLPNDTTIKFCFLYCALYPEDHSIDKAKLIDYWIGEGLISLNEFDHIDDARNKGYDMIGILKGVCLLESGRDEETQVKMHDTIRDLALWIAHDYESKRDKMLIIKTSDLTAERSSRCNAERIYLIPPPPDGGETKVRPPLLPSPTKSPNLITLIHHFRYDVEYRDLSVLPQNFFEFTPRLRVLDLSNTNMETFPMSITKLVELRYLSLSSSDIKVLPKELGKLVKLNFLDLSHMYFLTIIPSGVIGSLLKLRVLNLYKCYRLDWDLDEVYKLKHLNDLVISIYAEHNLNKLLSNQNPQMCIRHLNLELIPEANMGIEQQQKQHHHLGSSSCYQNLIQIVIFNCNGLKDLTWVGYGPNLKILQVSFCDEIVILVDDFGRSTGGGGGGGGGDETILTKPRKIDIFKSLETLQMRSLPKLKSICRNALAFPCLESLEVLICRQLKKLPFDSGSNVNNTLRKIKGGPKWWSELQWEEEDHNNNNNNNNNNHELLKSKFLPYFVEDLFSELPWEEEEYLLL